jgi:hypothetical protein
VQFVILKAEYEKQMSGLTVESVEIDTAKRSAKDHERFDYVLWMTIERVQEGESVTGGARHDILALDKRADEPGLVPQQIQPASQTRQLLDDSGFRVGLEGGNYVTCLKATGEIQHSARCRRASRNFGAPWRNSQHLVVEPDVQHRFAEAPLISDFDSG